MPKAGRSRPRARDWPQHRICRQQDSAITTDDASNDESHKHPTGSRAGGQEGRPPMTDPPGVSDPADGGGDGAATNDSRPHRYPRRPHTDRASSTTVTRHLATQESSSLSDAPQSVLDLVWRLLGDHRRASWLLVFVLVFVVAFMGAIVATLLAVGPQLPAVASGLTGTAAGVVGGSTAVGTVFGIRKAIQSQRRSSS